MDSLSKCIDALKDMPIGHSFFVPVGTKVIFAEPFKERIEATVVKVHGPYFVDIKIEDKLVERVHVTHLFRV